MLRSLGQLSYTAVGHYHVRTYVRTYSGIRIFAHTNVCAYVITCASTYYMFVRMHTYGVWGTLQS